MNFSHYCFLCIEVEEYSLGLLGVPIFFQKIFRRMNIFLKCTSPPPLISNGPSHFITAVCVLLSCHDSHSVKGATVVGKVQKRNRYQASLGIHKTIIMPDFKLLGEAEYFPPFDRASFITKQGLTEL